ncbi:MAG: hypothetical protein GY900_00395 [Actinomycetia bacterium]|nr:hypothetical protein [Actinomycetes bacterium]MDP6287134.1 hypothetical protein [Acidimicrobiales bacterium]
MSDNEPSASSPPQPLSNQWRHGFRHASTVDLAAPLSSLIDLVFLPLMGTNAATVS